jgi:hypothetical protein
MTNEFDRKDRFGCGQIAMAVFWGLVMVGIFLAWIALSNENWQQSLQNFFNGQQQQENSGPGQGVPQADVIPAVSDRYFASGSAQVSVSDGIEISPSLEVEAHTSYANEGLLWLSFLDRTNPDAGEILLVLDEPENSLAVVNGPLRAIGTDDQCVFTIQVSDAMLSGHVSCSEVDVLNNEVDTGTNASIELDFQAATDTTAE